MITIQGTLIFWEVLRIDPVERLRVNCARPIPRFVPHNGIRPEPVAVVAYGRSLNESWEKIRGFPVVFSCSGSHRFLLERGIVPTYHVDSDPQPHKPSMLGEPHPEVTYLIASICDGRYFDILSRNKVLLWHLLFLEPPELFRALPEGELLWTGGNSVGVRAMRLARALGYVNQHLFGFDGSDGYPTPHPTRPDSELQSIEHDGETYRTTPEWVTQSRRLFEDLNRSLKDVNPTFHGRGLVQDMAKRYVRRVEEGFPLTVIKQGSRLRVPQNVVAGAHAENTRETEVVIATAKRVLIIGGDEKRGALPPQYAGWQIVHVDPGMRPDMPSDAHELLRLAPAQYDAVYCAHQLVHCRRDEVPTVLTGFHHVLKPDGFAHIRVTDVQALMRTVAERSLDIDDELGRSEAGPITVHDLLYGYGAEIERSGRGDLANKTGFSAKSLPRALRQAGFTKIYLGQGPILEITAFAFKSPPGEAIRKLLNLPG
jgi:hypothetical protein